MRKFKAGDRVRRINDQHGNFRVWETGIIAEYNPSNNRYTLEGDLSGHVHHPINLELVADAEFRETTFAPLPERCLVDPVTGTATPLPSARKDDDGKLDMNLLDDMPRALKGIVEVMQWAITEKKPVPYVRGSWLGVSCDRYRAALKRHERSASEQATADVPARFQRDPETSLLHLAHTACSAMMALENALREQEAKS